MESPDSTPVKYALNHWSKGLSILSDMIQDINEKNDKSTWRDEEVTSAFREISDALTSLAEEMDHVHPIVQSLIAAFTSTYAGGFPAWVQSMDALFKFISDKVTESLEDQYANSPDE